MSFDELGIVALVFYLATLAGIAEIARRARRDRTPADHFLAGRDLGAFVLFLTLYATTYSGNSMLGYPGEAYRRGFSWIMATGFMMSIVVVFHAVAPRLRPIAMKGGFVTPGDWVRHRFGHESGGRALGLAVAVLMTIALANFLFAQLKAMGELAEQVTGGAISYEWGVVLLAATVLFYETLGGMRAVAWTDAAQGILMMLGLGALLFWLLRDVGGIAPMSETIMAVRPEAAAVPDATECANWASTILLLGLASAVYPQAIQRIYAARSGAVLRRSMAVMTFMPLVTILVVTLIGLVAITHFEDLGVIEADRVMPLLLAQWAAAGPIAMAGAVLVFIGALAAIMSTADSVLLSLGSLAAEDLVGRPREDPTTTRLGKRIAMGVMVAMVVGAIVSREITLWGLVELKMELLIQCVPAFLLALHWTGLRAGPALAGVLVGTAVAVAGVGLGASRIGGVHLGVIGLLANLAVASAGSWWGKAAPAPRPAPG